MFKKYTIIALGALMIAGQANGMGSWARKLWAPSAVAAASVFTAKTTLCKNQFTMNGDPISLSRQYSDAQLDPEALSKLLESQISFLTLSPSNSFGPEKTEELLSYTKCLQKTFNDNPKGANIDGKRLYHKCSRGVNLGYPQDELAHSVSSVLRRREKENINKYRSC